MLRRVIASEFVRATQAGKTRPAFLRCEDASLDAVEVVAKFSAGCDRGVTDLAIEALAACLAGDLGLPIPEPFLVEIPSVWADAVPADRRKLVQTSSPVAFGSKLITGGYRDWNAGSRLSAVTLPIALSVIFFDAMIQNADRRPENPNCIVSGDNIRIFDHDGCFMTKDHGIIGWKPPWEVGGLKPFETKAYHIFSTGLRKQSLDFSPIKNAWTGLPDERLADYLSALPPEWAKAKAHAEAAVKLVSDVRDNIDACILEMKRVLK